MLEGISLLILSFLSLGHGRISGKRGCGSTRAYPFRFMNPSLAHDPVRPFGFLRKTLHEPFMPSLWCFVHHFQQVFIQRPKTHAIHQISSPIALPKSIPDKPALYWILNPRRVTSLRSWTGFASQFHRKTSGLDFLLRLPKTAQLLRECSPSKQ